MKSMPIEMTGQRFGRLVVLGRSDHKSPNGHAWWRVRCDCGKLHEVSGPNLRAGNTQSCGCLAMERIIEAGKDSRKHGHGSSGKNSPTYSSWISMRKRCNDPHHHAYAVYGGAGVTVCESWDDFRNFLADMGERPAGKTLDRFPNHAGNYEPNNCRWATKKEQAQNRKNTVWIEKDGERKCVSDWALVYGIDRRTLASRLRYGWSFDKAVTTPIRSHHG